MRYATFFDNSDGHTEIRCLAEHETDIAYEEFVSPNQILVIGDHENLTDAVKWARENGPLLVFEDTDHNGNILVFEDVRYQPVDDRAVHCYAEYEISY